MACNSLSTYSNPGQCTYSKVIEHCPPQFGGLLFTHHLYSEFCITSLRLDMYLSRQPKSEKGSQNWITPAWDKGFSYGSAC